MLVEHRINDVNECFITVKEAMTACQQVAFEPALTQVLGQFLRDVARSNPHNFRVFSPDENASNRLTAIYEATKKTWLAEYLPEDADGGELAPDGRVMEMLSEHTLEGWLEGYVLTGRHGFFSTYEAFVHVIDSMFNQHAKWLEKCTELARGYRLAQSADYVHRVAAGS
jgi:xylulose-5-phosphate/fructose-6-phosphate phosphoketolase